MGEPTVVPTDITAPMRLDLPFRIRDRDGVVHVSVEPNRDPDEFGHGLVAIGYDPVAFTGFPCVEASIAYAGRGPRGWLGWVQVIVRTDTDGGVVSSVDAVPFSGEGSPLYTFGYLPTFSDFPANPDHPDGDWVADAFLVAIPDVVRSRILQPVVGFRWGYRLRNHRAAGLIEPTPVGAAEWNLHRPMLGEFAPDWTFATADA